MRYLWNQPIGLDNAKLVAFLGGSRNPLDTALRATLADMAAWPKRPTGARRPPRQLHDGATI